MAVQANASNEFFKCRRGNVWTDYLEHRKKPWSNATNNLVVTFLKESALDTGGPKREFFTGFINFFFIFFKYDVCYCIVWLY